MRIFYSYTYYLKIKMSNYMSNNQFLFFLFKTGITNTIF